MLTQEDLQKVGDLFEQKLDQKLDQKLEAHFQAKKAERRAEFKEYFQELFPKYFNEAFPHAFQLVWEEMILPSFVLVYKRIDNLEEKVSSIEEKMENVATREDFKWLQDKVITHDRQLHHLMNS